MKLKWKISSAQRGKFASFIHRGWPSAEYADGSRAGHLAHRGLSYMPAHGRDELAATAIEVYVADYSVTPWVNRRLKARFTKVSEAKQALERFLDAHPGFVKKTVIQREV